MAYPFAGFSSFLFQRDEMPTDSVGGQWNVGPNYQKSRPLGATRDSILTVAVGSAVRSFECYMFPARYATLRALINTAGLFTDWTRPTPDSRQAFLDNAEDLGSVAVLCDDGTTQRKIRVRVTLTSQ